MDGSLSTSLMSWDWFELALLLFVIEWLWPGRFALWLGFAAVLVGMIASVARWPWPAQVAALVILALLMIPAWRRYERKGSGIWPKRPQSTSH